MTHLKRQKLISSTRGPWI